MLQHKHLHIISSISIFWFILVVKANNEKPVTSYTAAVVEFSPERQEPSEHPSKLILKNAARYVDIMITASQHSVDIIVFPECGLTTMSIPGAREHMLPYLTVFPQVGANPCDDPGAPQVLHMISCAARKTKMYVVFNLGELVYCTGQENCSSDGKLIYNSNLALDRNGTIVAKYRKFHLFGEPGFNITKIPEHSWFDTDFGTRFGTFICFDILFSQPSMDLISKYNVSNFAYPTAWFQHLPFYIATSVQSGWADGNRVNLLASGYSDTSNSNAGSGIYAGNDGPIAVVLPDHSATKLLIANISSKEAARPKPTPIVINISENKNSSLEFLHSMKVTNFASAIITKDDARFKYHTDLFSCEVKLRIDSLSDRGPKYRFLAFAGDVRYPNQIEVYTEVCGVVACANSTLESCIFRSDFQSSTTVFSKISISAVTKTNLVSFAITVDENLLPLSGESYKFNTQNKSEDISIRMYTESRIKNLIAFTLYRSG